MAIFQDVTIGWKDEQFTIPGNKVLGAIAIVEEHITFTEMIDALGRGRPPLVAIAKAFAGVTEELRSPYDLMREKVEALQAAQADGKITAEGYGNAQFRAAAVAQNA